MRIAFLSLMLILASCSEGDRTGEPGNGIEVPVWPPQSRTDVINGLGIRSASELNRHDLSHFSVAHGGKEKEREMTPDYLSCLARQKRARNYEVVSFGFSDFAGPRPASVNFAFDTDSDRLICADVFRPKE